MISGRPVEDVEYEGFIHSIEGEKILLKFESRLVLRERFAQIRWFPGEGGRHNDSDRVLTGCQREF